LAVPFFHFRPVGNETGENPLFQVHRSRSYLAIVSNRKAISTPASRIYIRICFAVMRN
jgi:hypothetical protein